MEALQAVLTGYGAARAHYGKVPDPTDNADAAVRAIRLQLPGLFKEVLDQRQQPERYRVSGSVGEYPLNMAAIPWVAAFRRDVTTGARRGYYVVLLFSEDGKTAVLSLNQGFHDFLQEYKPLPLAERKARTVAAFAGSILRVPVGFARGQIRLNASGDLGRGYQQGAILSKIYDEAANLSEQQFRADLGAVMDAYDELVRIAGASLASLLPPPSDDEFQEAVQEEAKTADLGKTTTGPQPKPSKVPRQGGGGYVRDPKVAGRALAAAKYQCVLATASSPHPTFIAKSTGQSYVEAHHLVPMSRQDIFSNSLDVEDNVVALCPNCHRQAHLGRPADRRAIIKQLMALRSQVLKSRGIDLDLSQLSDYYAALAEDD